MTFIRKADQNLLDFPADFVFSTIYFLPLGHFVNIMNPLSCSHLRMPTQGSIRRHSDVCHRRRGRALTRRSVSRRANVTCALTEI
jgi:hypothetical protein